MEGGMIMKLNRPVKDGNGRQILDAKSSLMKIRDTHQDGVGLLEMNPRDNKPRLYAQSSDRLTLS